MAQRKYGAASQEVNEPTVSPLVNKANQKLTQKVTGKMLYIVRSVDTPLLKLLSAIVSTQASPLLKIMEHIRNLLNYIAS